MRKEGGRRERSKLTPQTPLFPCHLLPHPRRNHTCSSDRERAYARTRLQSKG